VFDFRYHVASLIAVFIALVIGILVGIGLSGRGFVSDAERTNLEARISELRSERDSGRAALALATKRQAAADFYLADTYPTLVVGRLRGLRIAVVSVGSIDQTVDRAVIQAIREAGGRILRVRVLRVPMDVAGVERIVANRPGLKAFAGADRLGDLGRGVAAELVDGGKTPLLDALGDTLLEERDGNGQPPVDAIVISRPAPPQQGSPQRFLSGLYAGFADGGLPAVGVERATPRSSAVPAFVRSGLSTVDSVDTATGRLALVLELAGAASGHYGVGPAATDGILPPFPLTTGQG
jgi:hypothetical protein